MLCARRWQPSLAGGSAVPEAISQGAGDEACLVPNAAASMQRRGWRPLRHRMPLPPASLLPSPHPHRAPQGPRWQQPSGPESGSGAAPASTQDNRVATVQSVVRQTATCRGTPAQSDRPTAQPDAGVPEAPRADTFAQWGTAGFRGSYLETFSGYVRAAALRGGKPKFEADWVSNDLLCLLFARAARMLLLITRELSLRQVLRPEC